MSTQSKPLAIQFAGRKGLELVTVRGNAVKQI